MKNKKVFLLGVLVGLLLCGTTVYAASVYYAKDISYTPNNDNFKVDNVESALNTLYEEQSKKISSLGKTYTNRYYNGTKNEMNEVTLELEKGTYLCSAVYGNAGGNASLDTFADSGQSMTISNCDTYNELYSYQKYQTGTTKYNDINSEVLVGKNFTCIINDNKTIEASVSTGAQATYYPIGMEFSCTKLIMD